MNNLPIEVLVINDDLAEAGKIKEMLSESTKQEFSVQHVRSQAEGLSLLRSREFDVILVDLELPGSKGLEMALALRELAKLTPIIVLNAPDDEDTALKALQMDIQEYLIRGELTGSVLKRSIRWVIQRKRTGEALRESEQRFSSFMLHLPAAAWMKDKQGLYVYGNAETERIFSLPSSAFCGKRDEEFLPLATAMQFRENDERVSTEGGSLRTTEVLRLPDGVDHQYVVSKFIVPDPDGRTAYIAGVAFDITELKRAEEALRFSEAQIELLNTDLEARAAELEAANHELQLSKLKLEAQNEELRSAQQEADELRSRYQDLYDFAPTGYFTLNEHGIIVEVNLAGASFLGVERSLLLNQPLSRFLAPESSEELVLFCRRVLSVNTPEQCEVRFGENGSVRRWMLLEGKAAEGGDDGPKMCRVAIIDITDRRQTEEALRKSEMKFTKVFHAVPALIGISTLEEGRIIDVNEAVLQTLGYRRDEIIGRTVTEINLWEKPADRADVLQSLKEQGSVQNVEIRFRGKTGQVFTGLLSAEFIELDGERYMLSLVRDITMRKRAEEALIRAKEEWERTFDSVPDLIAILDNEYSIVRVNRAMAQKLGRHPEECVGLLCYKVFHETESPPEFCPHVKALTDGREHCVEMHEAHLGGDFLVSHTPLLTPDGIMTGVVHVARDITERRRAEIEIERLNADLTARATELEEVNRELETFNYTVAHDLRQPLNIISSYCQLLEEMCGNKIDEQCQGYLHEAYNGTLRMNRLIDALLNFSRMARIEIRPEEVDLCDMAHAVAAELRLAEPERRVDLRIAEGMSVYGDANLLRVVLDNLLGNAWKYTRMRDLGVIEFGLTQIDGQQACFVQDNGPGFAAADADKLFIPFQRLPGTEEYRGFGIGLATVERIIRRHGGRVWAEGEPGKGATFYFTL